MLNINKCIIKAKNKGDLFIFIQQIEYDLLSYPGVYNQGRRILACLFQAILNMVKLFIKVIIIFGKYL